MTISSQRPGANFPLSTRRAAEAYQLSTNHYTAHRLHWSKDEHDVKHLGGAQALLELIGSLDPAGTMLPSGLRLSHLMEFQEEDESLEEGGWATVSLDLAAIAEALCDPS